MKRIVFAVDDIGISGIITVVNNLIIELLNKPEYEICVLCLSISDRKRITEKVDIYNMDINKYGRKQRYIRLVPSIKKYFMNNKADVLVICGMEFVPFYYFATKKIENMKKIAWEHLNFNSGPKYRLEWFGKRIACRYFDNIVCLTKKDYGYYLNYCNDQDKIRQIYNVSHYRTGNKEYNIQSKTIISVGYLGRIKGFDMLMQVAETVFAKRKDWVWEIYGKGVEEENLKKLIMEKKLENNVFLKGFSDDIVSAYGQSSFFVMTSRLEGMPSVLLEAQKSFLPVISFDIDTGPSDVIKDKVNGYLIKPFDLSDMINKINYLIENDRVRNEMAGNSMMFHDRFVADVIVNEWKEIL